MKWHNLQHVLRDIINEKGEIKIETPNGDIYTIKEIDEVFKPFIGQNGKQKLKIGDEIYILNEENGWWELDGNPIVESMLSMKTNINENPALVDIPPSLPLTKEKKEMLLKAINTLISKEKRLILNLEGDTIEEMSLKNKEIFKFISENLCKDYEKLKKEIEDIKL